MDSLNFPILETKRLFLREIINEDAESIYQYLSDIEVIRYLEGNTDSVEEAKSYISWCRDTYNNKTDIRWGIKLKKTVNLLEIADLAILMNQNVRLS